MRITVYLLSRDRASLLEKNIKRFLKLNLSYINLIVSDNSKDIKEIKKLQQKYKKIKFLFRGGKILLSQHMKICFENDISSDLLFFSHDDDIVELNFFKHIVSAFKKYPDSIAYATSSINFYDNKNFQDKAMPFNDKKKYIHMYSSELFKRWVDIDEGYIAPFSSYVYNMKLIRNINFRPPNFLEGGHFFDTIFLYNLSKENPITWINQPLIKIRIHSSSITSMLSFDYKFFYNYCLKKDEFNKYIVLLRKFRKINLLNKIQKKGFNYFNLFNLKIIFFCILQSKFVRSKIIKKILLK